MRYSRNARRPGKKNYNRKIYVAYKPCKEPHILCKFYKEWKEPMDLTLYGLHYKEDEIGYYTESGYLELNPNLE